VTEENHFPVDGVYVPLVVMLFVSVGTALTLIIPFVYLLAATAVYSALVGVIVVALTLVIPEPT
jgi:hypothetical protein